MGVVKKKVVLKKRVVKPVEAEPETLLSVVPEVSEAQRQAFADAVVVEDARLGR